MHSSRFTPGSRLPRKRRANYTKWPEVTRLAGHLLTPSAESLGHAAVARV